MAEKKMAEKKTGSGKTAVKNTAASKTQSKTGAKAAAGKPEKKTMTPGMKKTIRRAVAGICLASSLVIAAIPSDRSGSAAAAQPALVRQNNYSVLKSINELNGVKSDESYYSTGVSGGNRGLNYTEDKAEATPVSLASTTSLSGNQLNLDPNSVSVNAKRWSYIINDRNELVEIYEYYTDQPTGYPAPVGIISGLNPSQVSSVADLNVNHMLCGNFDYYLPDEYSNYMYDTYQKYDYTVVGDPTQENPVIKTDHGVAYVSGDPSIVKGQMSLSKLGELFAEAGTIIDLYREQKQKYLSDKGVDDVTYDKLVEDGYWGSNIVKLVYDGTQVEEPYVVFCKDHQDRFKTGYLTHHTLTPISTAFMGDLYDPVTGNKVTSKPGNILVVTDTSGSPDPNLCDAAGHKYAQTTNAVAIAQNAFQYKTVIESVTLDGEFQYVGDAAFKSCTSLKTADFKGVKFIGNDVFNDCAALNSVNLDDGLKVIGNQAFYHCVELPEITVPPAVNTIGFGAFAECTKMEKVKINSNDACQIRDYAFFNDPAISNVTFSSGAAVSLGKAAFALGEASTLDKMMSFTFPTALTEIASSPSYTLYGADVDLFVNPAKITGAANASASINSVTDLTALKSACEYQSRMGDFLLANRQYLTEVNLKVLGSSTPERLPMNTFQGCLRLKDVVLDSAQNQLKLDANLFRSSTINELTVNGPEYATADTGRQDGAGRYYARPRMSTWACFSAVADYVPYCYPENHYEVGYPIQDDSFLFDLATEGNTASIRSCTYMGNIAAAGLFGTTKDKPFSIPDVVAGYKVSALQDGCLDSVRNNIVYLQIPDNTLTTLNSKVFLESKELKGVDIGNSVTSIGEGCFMKCEKLEEATIGEGISSIDKNCFADCPKLKHIYWDVPTVPGAVNIGEGAFKTIPSGTPASQVNALYFHGYAEDASYGPLAYAMSGVTIDEKGTGICYMSPVNVNVNGFSTPVDESEIQTYSMIMDKKTGKITLIDYPHFDDLPMDIQQKFLNGQSLTDPERTLVLESTIIQVPAAVQSIDVNSFLNNNINNLNWTYLTSEKQKRYSGSIKTVSAPDGAISENVPGLFSGTTNETAAIQAGAEQALGCELAGDATFSEASPDHDERGNDWITKVTLPRVESIPEGAFDSCERLGVVNIGEACTSVGTLAFRDCNELKTIETAYTTANPYFEFNNYILYENLTSGGKEINCCLPYRGKEMGPETSIGPEADGEYLNQVVSIHESAFAGCDRIRSADLSGTGLTRVGAGCFDGCSKLNTIKLPESITNIGDRAFTGCADGLTVTIPNMMTYITKDAFDPPSSGNVVYVRTPKDSTAYNITNVVVPENRNINWVDMVAFMVKFYNDDRVTQIGETQIIETPGTNARIPDTGNLISTRNPDAAFSHWEWANPATGEIVTGQRTVENVNEDRDIIAVYDSVTHTITFNNDDGSNITTRIVDHGDVAPVPNERNLTTKLHPGEEDQYEFSRWLVTIGGATASFDPHDDPVTADTICTAYFEKKGSGGGGSTSDNTPTPTGGGGDGTNTPTPTGGGNSGTSTPTPTGGGSGDTGTPTPTGGSGSSSSNSATGKGYFAIVENGSGSGQYPAGSVITITAYAPPAGKAFDRWTTSNTDIGISNAKAVSTTFIMPSHDVKVTATYAGAATSGNVAVPTAGPVPTRGTASGNTPVAPTPVPGGTEVRITTDAIDNNKKNLGAATVTGSNETFIVKVTDSAAATAAVEAALRERYGERFTELRYAPFDISLYDSTGTYLVQNANNLAVTITLPIPEALLAYGGNNKAGAVANGVLEDLAVQFTTIDGVPCMRFTATHFSPYVIYADTGNLVRGMTDVTPKTGDGIAPKWFLSAGMLSMSCVLFLWKDKKYLPEELAKAKEKKG